MTERKLVLVITDAVLEKQFQHVLDYDSVMQFLKLAYPYWSELEHRGHDFWVTVELSQGHFEAFYTSKETEERT